jgi:hypothetical protein
LGHGRTKSNLFALLVIFKKSSGSVGQAVGVDD